MGNVSIWGASYTDVPFVTLPKTGGGTARFDDTSDANATASDLSVGKTAYVNGVKITGTNSGGGGSGGNVWQDQDGYVHLDDEAPSGQITVEPLSVTQNGTYTAPTGKAYTPVTVNVGDTPTPTPPAPWVRPSDWPDLSQMDVSGGNILYMTSYADVARGFCSFIVNCTGNYTVEVGSISGSTFTADSTQDYASGTYCELYYGSANGTYKVLRVTGNTITKLQFTQSTAKDIDGHHVYTNNQGVIDVVGKLPSCTSMSCTYQRNLVNVDVDGLVLRGSMSSMFSGCYSLTSLDVSSWSTGSVTNMSSMFQNCSSLTSLDVSSWSTGSVTSMGYMFSGCSSLTSLDVSSWSTGSVTNMGYMFSGCYSLTSLDVSSWSTGSVTSMSNMFSGCSSLTSLDVSSWSTGSVTSMSSMFSGCYSLTSLDVSSWSTGSVTSMSSMFQYCSSLTSLDVSSWSFAGITQGSNTQQMFYNCYGLYGTITLPANMSQIGVNCFNATRSLYEWHFLATTPPTLANTNAFGNMTDFGGKKIYVPSASLSSYQTASNWSTYASYMVGE